MQPSFAPKISLTVVLALAVVLLQGAAHAQYKVTSLTANRAGRAANTDPHLVNAWGLTYAPGSPFWISDNVTGLSTLYKADGSAGGAFAIT